MRSNKVVGRGLLECEEALQRLLEGRPVVAEHVGLSRSKITASIVSFEAGFDRGYLKKSRNAHLPILARIEAFRAEANRGAVIQTLKKLTVWKISLMPWRLN
jgi:hypothetical protein